MQSPLLAILVLGIPLLGFEPCTTVGNSEHGAITVPGHLRGPIPLQSPLMVKGVSAERFASFSNMHRVRLMLDANLWMQTARGGDTNFIGDMHLIHFEVLPMTNAFLSWGLFSHQTNESPLFGFNAWCGRVCSFEDYGEVWSSYQGASKPKNQRPRLSEKQAIGLARLALLGSTLDEKQLHLGAPEIERISVLDPGDKTGKRRIKIPYYLVSWKDEEGGSVGVWISGLSKRIIRYENGSKFLPRYLDKSYPEALGLPPFDPAAGPRLN